jgi:hypothetical protein
MSPPSEPAKPGTKRLIAPALAAAASALAIVAAFPLGYTIASHHTTVRTPLAGSEPAGIPPSMTLGICVTRSARN